MTLKVSTNVELFFIISNKGKVFFCNGNLKFELSFRKLSDESSSLHKFDYWPLNKAYSSARNASSRMFLRQPADAS